MAAKAQREKRRAIKVAGGPEAYEAKRAALQTAQEAERNKKERLAALRRGLRRRYGPRPDGIKLMIAERSRMYSERRRTSPEEPKQFRREAGRPFDLEALRARHRIESARER